MTHSETSFQHEAQSYLDQLHAGFTRSIMEKVEGLANQLQEAWEHNRNVFICGNGGSAANALHIANDLHYGIGICDSKNNKPGLRVEALPANTAVLSCLANDIGYENIYSHQIEVKADQKDILIVLSGSGNSANIINALQTAKNIGLTSFAIVAFTGGECKSLADHCIHFPINDMQIAEDTQLLIGHLCMKWLNSRKPEMRNS